MEKDQVASAIRETFVSVNVPDANFEPSNVVDALASIANSINYASKRLGTGNAATEMGAIEAHGAMMIRAAEKIADAISELAAAIRETK